MEIIVPSSCVVGAARWEIKQVVQDALRGHTIPEHCPRGWLYVPPPVRSSVLQWCHLFKLAYHPGYHRTLALFQRRFCWPSMSADTREFVSASSVCAHSKSSLRAQAGLLHPLTIPHQPWSHVAVDFVTGLPPSDGNTVILTIVDHFFLVSPFCTSA